MTEEGDVAAKKYRVLPAQTLIHKGQAAADLLNMVEMAFRAYNPCFACATHSLPGYREGAP